jgi:predicted lipoprotein with Yx(FWY)xxD motif
VWKDARPGSRVQQRLLLNRLTPPVVIRSGREVRRPKTQEVTMRHSSLLTASVASALLLLTAACGSSDPAAAPAASSSAAAGVAVPPPSEVTALKMATTPLGEVVTDGDGRTLYLFSTDGRDATQSACTGACLEAWPPALVGSAAPSVSGVTGKLGSITAPGGGRQLTLGGWPLYYYGRDAAVGDTKGQAVGNVWWVLDGSGSAIMGSSSGGGY